MLPQPPPEIHAMFSSTQRPRFSSQRTQPPLYFLAPLTCFFFPPIGHHLWGDSSTEVVFLAVKLQRRNGSETLTFNLHFLFFCFTVCLCWRHRCVFLFKWESDTQLCRMFECSSSQSWLNLITKLVRLRPYQLVLLGELTLTDMLYQWRLTCTENDPFCMVMSQEDIWTCDTEESKYTECK